MALRNQGVGPGWMDVGWAMRVVREGRRMPLCVRMHMAGTHSGFGGRGGGVWCLAVLGGGDLGRQAPHWSIKPPTNHTPTHDEGGGAWWSEGRGLVRGQTEGREGSDVCAGPKGQWDGWVWSIKRKVKGVKVKHHFAVRRKKWRLGRTSTTVRNTCGQKLYWTDHCNSFNGGEVTQGKHCLWHATPRAAFAHKSALWQKPPLTPERTSFR